MLVLIGGAVATGLLAERMPSMPQWFEANAVVDTRRAVDRAADRVSR